MRITQPFLALTLFGLATLDPLSPRLAFIHAGALVLAWLTYFYIVNEWPNLTIPLALIVLLQGGVALGQFAVQGDLGLLSLGELPLNPQFPGVTVLWAREMRWLRAYGLTAHPNLAGAILAMALLFLLPAYERARGRRQGALLLVVAVGLAALYVTFSRAAWLAFLVGVTTWMILGQKVLMVTTREGQWQIEWGSWLKRPLFLKMLWPLLPSLLLLLLYGDLALSRFLALDSRIEANSLNQRALDSRVAAEIINDNLLFGVGLGDYANAAWQIDGAALRVHNVPLLVTAELGLVGLSLWLLLVLAPFWPGSWRPSQDGPTPGWWDHTRLPPLTAAQYAPWLAMIVISLFDTMLWVSSNWQTGILFALVAAHMAWELTRSPTER